MGNTVSKVSADYFAFATMPNGLVDLDELNPKRHLKMATYDLPMYLESGEVNSLTPASLKGAAIQQALSQIVSGDRDKFLISKAEMAETTAASCYLLVVEHVKDKFKVTVPWDSGRVKSTKDLIRWRKDILDGKQVGGDIIKCSMGDTGVYLVVRVTVPYDYTK